MVGAILFFHVVFNSIIIDRRLPFAVVSPAFDWTQDSRFGWWGVKVT